ncbi:MAG: SymE family type I addiction module toxin [Candidatus Thiodiazotropha sp. 4PDIV1]
MQKRKLMVRQGHRDYSLKNKPSSGNPRIPFILLKGSWLEESGFVIGLSISIQVSQNQLIITPR